MLVNRVRFSAWYSILGIALAVVVVLFLAFTLGWVVVRRRQLRKKIATAEISGDDAKIPQKKDEMEVSKHFKKFRIDH